MRKGERLSAANPAEFSSQIRIPADLIDPRDEVLYHGNYITLYEAERAKYVKALLGIEVEEMPATIGLYPTLREILNVRYRLPLREGNLVTVYTLAEVERSHLVFRQRMELDGREANRFSCAVAMLEVGSGRPPKGLPEYFVKAIKGANFRQLQTMSV